jgi:hypothetical protein
MIEKLTIILSAIFIIVYLLLYNLSDYIILHNKINIILHRISVIIIIIFIIAFCKLIINII